jgi:hypothetical protein
LPEYLKQKLKARGILKDDRHAEDLVRILVLAYLCYRDSLSTNFWFYLFLAFLGGWIDVWTSEKLCCIFRIWFSVLIFLRYFAVYYFQPGNLTYKLPVFEFQKGTSAEPRGNEKLPPGWVCITYYKRFPLM